MPAISPGRSARCRRRPRSSSRVLRKGAEKTVTLTLGELPNAKEARADADDARRAAADLAKLGLTLAPAARVAGAGGEGVVVTGVDSAGVAADRGFTTGDVILEVAGKAVSTPADVRKAIASARTEGKRTVLMRVKSGDNTRFVAAAGSARALNENFRVMRESGRAAGIRRPRRRCDLGGTGLVPVPALSGKPAGQAVRRFRTELQPWHPSPPLGWGR